MLEKLSYEEYYTAWTSRLAKLDDDKHEWLQLEHQLIHPPDEEGGYIIFYCPTSCYVQAGRTVSIPTGYKINGIPYSFEYKASKNTCLVPGEVLGKIKKDELK